MNTYKKLRNSMFLFDMRVTLAAVLALAALSIPAVAYIAVSLDPRSSGGTPAAGSNHGWQFNMNEPIIVTHLGLFDDDDDGFDIAHPIGLWRLSDAMLLASGTISTGAVDTLLDHFRYIDIPDVALSMGEDYVIGYYSASGSGDRVITNAYSLEVDPAINIVAGRWGYADELGIPQNSTSEDRFGPNFQFIPEPTTVTLLGLGALSLIRSKSRNVN
jgi:hypothetical protein